jgi:predicted DNA-binding protein with PD1-like motif
MSLIVGGDIEEVVYARLDAGADLLRGIQDVCKQRNIRTGYIFITGALLKARLQHYTEKLAPEMANKMAIDPIEVSGPMEASGHGLIGEAYAPSLGSKTFGAAGDAWRHGDVYVHVHLVVTNAEETICGHLLEGCLVRSPHPTSHFTFVIAKAKGVLLRNVADEIGSFHDLMKV